MYVSSEDLFIPLPRCKILLVVNTFDTQLDDQTFVFLPIFLTHLWSIDGVATLLRLLTRVGTSMVSHSVFATNGVGAAISGSFALSFIGLPGDTIDSCLQCLWWGCPFTPLFNGSRVNTTIGSSGDHDVSISSFPTDTAIQVTFSLLPYVGSASICTVPRHTVYWVTRLVPLCFCVLYH